MNDYQYAQNTHSGSRFLNELLDCEPKADEKTLVITDGSYSGEENKAKAETKTSHLLQLILLVVKQKTSWQISCSQRMDRGRFNVRHYRPKICNYIRQTGQCRLAFPRSRCENCPHRERCNPKFFNKTSVLFLSKKSSDHAKRQMKTEEFKVLARIRNGVETIPSVLRRKYLIDDMPVC